VDKTLENKIKNKWDDDIQDDIKIQKKRRQHFNFKNTSPSQGYKPQLMSTWTAPYQTRSVAASPSFAPIQTPPHEIQSTPSHDTRNSTSYQSQEEEFDPFLIEEHDSINSQSKSDISLTHNPNHSPPPYDIWNSPSDHPSNTPILPPHEAPSYQSQEEELDPSSFGDFEQMFKYHDKLSEKHDQVSYRINNFAEYNIPAHYPYGFPIQRNLLSNHSHCITQMSPLIYMFLGNFFDTYLPKTPNLDFKMYASPPVESAQKKIENSDFFQKQTIEFWMNLIAKEDNTIFLKKSAIIDRVIPTLRRRCLTFSLEAMDAIDECDMGTLDSDEFFGHRITLMIQRRGNGPIDLVIFDNKPSDEYHIDIHEYILDAMLIYTKTQISKINGRCDMFNSIQINKYSIDTGTHLKYEYACMACISISLRICIYLSIIDDFHMIVETELAYDLHLSHFTQQLRRMIHWIYNSMEYNLQQLIPIRSPEMTKLVFPIQKSHCYLGFIDAVELPERLISVRYIVSDDKKIKYLLDHGDPRYYDYSNDEENTFVRRHSPIKNVCVTQSRFLY